MNILPRNKANTPNYFCTWDTQCKIACNGYDARGMMREEILFGENGMARTLDENLRADLYFVIDDGWDVEPKIDPAVNGNRFGSQIVNEERFGLRNMSPQEKLKKLCEKVRSFGWKGLGIWICPQQAQGLEKSYSFENYEEEYWAERIGWSKYAGVSYWKVDWGHFAHDMGFRRKLTELAKRLYPELIIEHAVPQDPLNGFVHKQLADRDGRFTTHAVRLEETNEALEFSEVFRTYDILRMTATVTTLDRVAYCLKRAKGYVNAEDEMYINAVLGCAIGVMRSVYGKDLSITEPRLCNRLDETPAALIWQKIAPPFIGTETLTSDEILTDTFDFRENETWFAAANGKTVPQSAPAVIARNTALPTVTVDGIVPFVAACMNPSGAYAIGSYARLEGRNWIYPQAKVLCPVNADPESIGIFGEFEEIVFSLKGDQKIKRILAQSFNREQAVDITGSADPENHTIKVGNLARELWTVNDHSSPACMIRVEYQ